MSERNPSPRDFAETAKALSRNPLGILGLFQVLTYGVAALVAIFATSFTPFQRNVLTAFLIGFPLLLLLVFVWLVTRHSGKLFAPSDFRKDETYLQAMQMQAAVVRAGKLSEPEPVQEQVQLAIASPEVKTLPADDGGGERG